MGIEGNPRNSMVQAFDREPPQFQADVERCISIIRSARRPVKWGYVIAELGRPEFKGLEQAVRESYGVRRKNHKGKWYYST